MTPVEASSFASATDGAAASVTEEIVGVEHVELLQKHLRCLHGDRAHPNRTFHYDALLVTMLLGFYNPAARSLRLLDDLSCCEEVRDLFPAGLARSCRTTMSDALRQFDAARLLPIIASLARQVPALRRVDDDLHGLLKRVIAADGSYFSVPADVAWALAQRPRGGNTQRAIRLDLQLDVLRGLPTALTVSGADQGAEAASFAKHLEAGVIYAVDRGFVDFLFIHAVLDVGSDLVVRLKSDTKFVVTEERPLTDADRAAHVLSDRVGHVPGSPDSPGFGDRPLREVRIFDARNNTIVRLLTSILDVPAHTIGQVYRHRWQIELFFRWLKCVGRFEHLICHDRNGITIQFYVAVIGVLLTYLRTGNRPGVYEFHCLGLVASGRMSASKMQEVIARRQRERDLAKARRLAKAAGGGTAQKTRP